MLAGSLLAALLAAVCSGCAIAITARSGNRKMVTSVRRLTECWNRSAALPICNAFPSHS